LTKSAVNRRLAAILAADVVNFSRLMSLDEAGTLDTLKSLHKELVQPKITDHSGRIFKLMGDGLLAEFPSIVEAVQCAVDIQRSITAGKKALTEKKDIKLRIGVNLGDIIVEDRDIYGDGVNLAARLETLAEPGGICISAKVFEEVRNKLSATFEDLGEKQVKNIPEPIRVYRWTEAASDSNPSRLEMKVDLSLPDKPSIAVLPFTNMSGDPDQEHLCDGITEDIITGLSRLHWFLVIARNSSFIYKDKSVDVTQVGRELGVQYVLEGSIRKVGNRVRVAAQLVDAVSGAHYWAENFDRELVDIFELQDDITQSVTAAIEPKLVAAEGARSNTRSYQHLRAWDNVVQAMSHIGRMTSEDSAVAIKTLRSCIQNFPDYGPAHSLLAFSMLVSNLMGWTPVPEEYSYAAKLARRAAQLDDDDPWAHLALGYVAFTQRKTDEAVNEFTKALDLNSNFATAHGYLGWTLAFDAQSERAIHYFELALRISPFDPLKAFYFSGTGVAHYMARNYTQAVDWARSSIRERPDYTAGRRILCASLAQAGMTKEASDELAILQSQQNELSIEWIEQHVPYTQKAMPHFIDGMRKAGLG
jgi:TolB-like protein/class 3 adenylate cyclase